MAIDTATKTVVGLFDDMADAQRAVSNLENAGIPRNNINVVAGNDQGRYSNYVGDHEGDAGNAAKGAGKGAGAGAAIGGGLGLIAGLTALAIPGFGPIIAAGPIAAALTGAGIGAAAGGLIGGLTNAGVPKEEAERFAERVRQGSVLVSAQVQGSLADTAADIMDDAGARDVDENSGPDTSRTNYSGSTDAAPIASHQTTRPASTGSTRNIEGERHIPVIEEDIEVGKREVRRGGVRVFSEVHERPVEETVSLREEHVHVDRRPVDRAANVSDFEAFKEGTIELTETAEEAVVNKTARVREEVVVSKDVDQRTETIRDTLRSTDVRVDRLGSDFDQDYRADFEKRYSGGSYRYEQYQPAYEFGHRYASDDRYRGQEWSQVEPHIRRDWESKGSGTWENFKDSVQYAWNRARNRR